MCCTLSQKVTQQTCPITFAITLLPCNDDVCHGKDFIYSCFIYSKQSILTIGHHWEWSFWIQILTIVNCYGRKLSLQPARIPNISFMKTANGNLLTFRVRNSAHRVLVGLLYDLRRTVNTYRLSDLSNNPAA